MDAALLKKSYRRTPWADLQKDLEGLRQKDLYRSPDVVDRQVRSEIVIQNKKYINFSSNNYLGLANHPQVSRQAAQALKKWGSGSGASRLLSGNLKIHDELETQLAQFKGEEAAAIFSSGYLANLGVVTSLLNDQDVVLVDRLNHASLVDAARLSKAKLWVYPHRDPDALARLLGRAKSFRKRLVMTDAYFSMDGDVAPLDKLLEISHSHNALLMIDEAHSTGVFGPQGRGLTEHFRLAGQIDIVMGTLSKAIGSVGGYIAGKHVLKKYLINRCREYIYTTGPSPAASAASLSALELIKANPQRRQKLWANIHFIREGLKALDLDLMGSEGPIIPIRVGETRQCLLIKEYLKKEGFYVSAIRPPTVAKNTDRIRLSISSDHAKAQLQELLKVFKAARIKFL